MRSIQRGRTPAFRYASTERWDIRARLEIGAPSPVEASRSRFTTRSAALRSIASHFRRYRRADQDENTIGYIGELDSGASEVALPILNEAHIAMISRG
jgi:hypothetical protein